MTIDGKFVVEFHNVTDKDIRVKKCLPGVRCWHAGKILTFCNFGLWYVRGNGSIKCASSLGFNLRYKVYMINLSLWEPFESARPVFQKISLLSSSSFSSSWFELFVILMKTFRRRASLWSELYSEHPDNKKGVKDFKSFEIPDDGRCFHDTSTILHWTPRQ